MTRGERQAMLKRHSEWLEAHPLWRWGIALWFSLAVLVFSAAVKYGLERLTAR